MATTDWVVMKGTIKLMEAEAGAVLNYARTIDPFLSELEDGMIVGDVVISQAPAVTMQRTEEESALWSFTRTLHKQIHDAANAAHRGEYNQARDLLLLVQERVNNYMSR